MGREFSHLTVPVLKLCESQMVQHFSDVFWELSHEAGDINESVYTVRKREVISFGQDLNTVREGTLATDSLLESSARCSPNVDLTIEQAHNDELGRESSHVWFHDFRRVGSCEAPHYVAGCIAHMSTDGVCSKVDVVD